jgi:hypothetical protein
MTVFILAAVLILCGAATAQLGKKPRISRIPGIFAP